MHNSFRRFGRLIVQRDSARDKVVAHLKSASARGHTLPITDETELYYDLDFYGGDLYEFFIWVMQEFGDQPRVDVTKYAPSEGLFREVLFRWRQQRQRERGLYGSLTVGHVLDAIEAGHWLGDRGRDGNGSMPRPVLRLADLLSDLARPGARHRCGNGAGQQHGLGQGRLAGQEPREGPTRGQPGDVAES